jgi:putative oxidoreductase
MLGRIVKLSSIPVNPDAGLLVLRVLVFLILFVKHGWEKVFTFSAVVARVPDFLHIGVAPMIFLAAISDVLCAFLLVFGLATRWACAWSFVVLFVAWSLRDHFSFLGRGGDHGELTVLYLAVLIAVFITGPGRYSIDACIKD